MIRFDGTVNDRHIYHAGLEDTGVLHASVSWVKSLAGQRSPGSKAQKELDLMVGGMRPDGTSGDEHFAWPKRRLKVDDEVTIKIVDQPSADTSRSRIRTKPRPSGLTVAIESLQTAESYLSVANDPRAEKMREKVLEIINRFSRSASGRRTQTKSRTRTRNPTIDV
ncbi:MAG: hypothetical protein EPO39_08165 [Candidatus Manganitrophaceae bacterium]|nr:MAG: hypothetical protein EPO39_08165 [Candidatus Manganitrophaceae bacterium]